MAHGFCNLFRTGARTAVEHQFERLAVGKVDYAGGAGQLTLDHRARHTGLNITEQGGTQLDHAGLVGAVHITEREGGHVSATLAQTKATGHFKAIGRRGIEAFVDFGGIAVFLAADRADLDLQHRVRGLRLIEQLLGDVQIFLERHGGAVPHMRLECGLLTMRHLIGLMCEQRSHPFVQILLGAVIGVQGDGDVRVLRGDLVCKSGQGQRSGDTVVDADAGKVCGCADGHLDDAVGFGIREPLQRGVQRLRAGHVDGRVSVAAASCGV